MAARLCYDTQFVRVNICRRIFQGPVEGRYAEAAAMALKRLGRVQT